jgi:predicted nucleic acid-binding OB-fold protein
VREPVCCGEKYLTRYYNESAQVTIRVPADQLENLPDSAMREMARQLTLPRETQPFEVIWTNASVHSQVCTVTRATNGDWIFTWKP